MSLDNDYIDKGEIVFLDRHITDLESKLCESREAQGQILKYVHELGNTIELLKKVRDFYVRLS